MLLATTLLLLCYCYCCCCLFHTAAAVTAGHASVQPHWLSVSPEILQTYLALAKERHASAIQSAIDAHGTSDGDGTSESTSSSVSDSDSSSTTTTPTISSTITSTTTTAILPDPSQIVTLDPSTTKLPDFDTELGHSMTVTPLFTKDECDLVIQKANEHFNNNGGTWTTLQSGNYPVSGFWIKSVPSVHEWFQQHLHTKLLPLIQKQYPHFCQSTNDLCVDNAYLFKYTPETGRQTGIHTDSGCLSFTIALNQRDEYTGGGTWFENMDTTATASTTSTTTTSIIDMEQGMVTIRPGGVRHCGNAIHHGTRYIIGGFCMHRHKVEQVRMLIGMGNDYLANQQYQHAKHALECAIYLNPHFDGAYTHLAKTLQAMGDTTTTTTSTTPTTAQQVLEHCFHHVNPKNAEVAYSLGLLYLKQENYFLAKKCFDVCLQVDENDVDVMILMAQLCAGVGTPDGEISWYQRIIKLSPTTTTSKENLVSAYCNLGALVPTQEIEYYEQALELMPDNYPCRYSLACALASRKEWTRAAQHFCLAVQVAPDKMTPLSALYRVALNVVQHEGQHTSQAAMMARLQEVMGVDNYKLLAILKATQPQPSS